MSVPEPPRRSRPEAQPLEAGVSPARRILVAGAFDRFNFGDLLFARVLRRALRRLGIDAPSGYYATTAADLRPAGGVSTRPLDALRNEATRPEDLLIFAGGEILDAGWAGTYAALSSPGKAFAVKALDRTLGAETLARRLLGTRRSLPWVPSPEEAGGVRVAYWSAGGCGLASLPARRRERIRRALTGASDLSVRDPETLRVLRGWGLEVRLAPDGAVLASDLFPRRELLRGLSSPARRLLGRLGEGSYLCLQLGRYPSRGHHGQVAAGVAELQAALGCPVLLLPLGLAPAHEDPEALEDLRRRLEAGARGSAADLAVLAPGRDHPLKVSDLLALLASARLFAGTSLHGNLTALTYGVPRVGLGPGIRKLDLFLRTWDPTQPDGCAPFSHLCDRALESLDTPTSILENARQQVLTAAWENLRLLLANTSDVS